MAGRLDVTYVADGGNVVAAAAKVLRVPGPGRWLDPGPLGCLGVGAPFAFAAKALAPERPVCVLQGDGSFGLNGMDFETAVRFKLPMVSWSATTRPGARSSVHSGPCTERRRRSRRAWTPTRYDRIVEAVGGRGEHVDDPADLVPALERAFTSGTVYCVDVAIDPEAAAASGSAGYAI